MSKPHQSTSRRPARRGGSSSPRGAPHRTSKPRSKAEPLHPTEIPPDIEDFHEWALGDEVQGAIAAMGISVPTPIQKLAIGPVLEGRDVIAKAETGTGKTLAFGAPMMAKIDPARASVLGLVLCPTRELAEQVMKVLAQLGEPRGIKVALVVGGEPLGPQVKALKAGSQVVVGTPGRILDLYNQKFLSFPWTEFAILDEADVMLEIGFIDDVKQILSYTPDERQTLLFSATFPPELLDLARAHTKNPAEVATASGHSTIDAIEQTFMHIDDEDRPLALTRLIEQSDPDDVFLVFCDKRTEVDKLMRRLERLPFSLKALHGGYDQESRFRVMTAFRTREVKALVATDVASRGLDVAHVTHVVNYSAPRDITDYTHRIGRTGRAGRSGRAITFVTPLGMRYWKRILADKNWPIEEVERPGPTRDRRRETVRPERSEGPERGARPERAPRAEHGDRPGRVETPERSEARPHAERPGRRPPRATEDRGPARQRWPEDSGAREAAEAPQVRRGDPRADELEHGEMRSAPLKAHGDALADRGSRHGEQPGPARPPRREPREGQSEARREPRDRPSEARREPREAEAERRREPREARSETRREPRGGLPSEEHRPLREARGASAADRDPRPAGGDRPTGAAREPRGRREDAPERPVRAEPAARARDSAPESVGRIERDTRTGARLPGQPATARPAAEPAPARDARAPRGDAQEDAARPSGGRPTRPESRGSGGGPAARGERSERPAGEPRLGEPRHRREHVERPRDSRESARGRVEPASEGARDDFESPREPVRARSTDPVRGAPRSERGPQSELAEGPRPVRDPSTGRARPHARDRGPARARDGREGVEPRRPRTDAGPESAIPGERPAPSREPRSSGRTGDPRPADHASDRDAAREPAEGERRREPERAPRASRGSDGRRGGTRDGEPRPADRASSPARPPRRESGAPARPEPQKRGDDGDPSGFGSGL